MDCVTVSATGIAWRTLHVLDHSRYLPAHTDYLPLPLGARTHSTRLRWWQPPSPSSAHPHPQWAIDNVLIGGLEINPSTFQQSFDTDIPQQVQTVVFDVVLPVMCMTLVKCC